MLRKKLLLVVALGLICVSATSASAYDLCIQLSGGGGFVALKSPKIQLNCCPPLGSEVNTDRDGIRNSWRILRRESVGLN